MSGVSYSTRVVAAGPIPDAVTVEDGARAPRSSDGVGAMPLDFSQFDTRHYPVIDAARGYDEWAETYEDVVRDEMDLRLLERLESVDWSAARRAVDLACGTGRIGAWLRGLGVGRIDGIDLSGAMLARARARGLYETLRQGDLRDTAWPAAAYDLAVVSLVDEHLPDLDPLYAEAGRLLRPGAMLVLAGYHPQFLMTSGMPTHFHRAGGEAIAIETWVHLLADHVRSARRAGLSLAEMHEGLVDDEYIAGKPKWARYRNTPVSFAFAWRREADRDSGRRSRPPGEPPRCGP